MPVRVNGIHPDLLTSRSYPLGATVTLGGVNFCIFSKNCESLELLLFNDVDDHDPARVFQFDPKRDKTFYYWHLFVPGVGAGQLYGYRAHGPYEPDIGHRFDGSKVLLDPYARAIAVGEKYDRHSAIHPGDNCQHAMKSVVVNNKTYNWEGDKPLHLPFAETVIYELHVRGFTQNPNSGVSAGKRGTYAGLVEKIPYLKSLGVTAVELLPVQQFDDQDVKPPLKNYWGYNPIGFFAPHQSYASRQDPLGAVDDFRDMVKAFHRAGIEVILDVVFNHTAEGDHTGPTLSFRGLENRAYYILEQDRARYANFTGCGNTLNGNHSIVRRLIMDSLRYWVSEMHVDGFRFDLASVMARDEYGKPLENPPILWEIESDPILAGTKIIAEAWDAAGLYQLGTFIGHRWAEWNGRFRDDVRKFVKGDSGCIRPLANRILGSPDLFRQSGRDPNRSINFITCHDGFTLNDLVSFTQKHNTSNNENNQDGANDNYSWNCGHEGPAVDEQVEILREKQIRNLLSILFISQGTPMILMGDEFRRTQSGNNNAYCQDNEVSWLDWVNKEKHAGLLRFFRGLIQFTQTYQIFREKRFWAGEDHPDSPHILWHGVNLNQPDWGENSHSLAFELFQPDHGEHLYIALNAYWQALSFELPPLPGILAWHRIIDTSLPSPNDITETEVASAVKQSTYLVDGRSTVVLLALNRWTAAQPGFIN